MSTKATNEAQGNADGNAVWGNMEKELQQTKSTANRRMRQRSSRLLSKADKELLTLKHGGSPQRLRFDFLWCSTRRDNTSGDQRRPTCWQQSSWRALRGLCGQREESQMPYLTHSSLDSSSMPRRSRKSTGSSCTHWKNFCCRVNGFHGIPCACHLPVALAIPQFTPKQTIGFLGCPSIPNPPTSPPNWVLSLPPLPPSID